MIMITGDYLKTAIAIAKGIEILQDQDRKSFVPADKLQRRSTEEAEFGNPGGIIDDEEDFGIVAMDCGLLRPAHRGGEYVDEREMDALTNKVESQF